MKSLRKENSQVIGDICFDITYGIEQILNGNHNDLNKTDLENTNCNINEIRYFRSKIEENCRIYKDDYSKFVLKTALIKVVSSLDRLKKHRVELGCGIICNADINDQEITEHILKSLK